ncbi:MAG: serine-type D-Ala-D-Ala carboxypeptidase [Gammaproteobacteria bacterium]|nr:serine-type D-Ala-D-Ala carboxypeptidase [Gammaproteobacteria bacterium]
MKTTFLIIAGIILPILSSASSLVPPAPQIKATSYILLDAQTNKVIVEYEADERNPPASLTKIMTTYLVEQMIQRGVVERSEQVPVSIKAWKAEGSKMFIREGTEVDLMDLLRGVVIQSGNDASIALAEFIAGDEASFAQMMNEQAEKLGMLNSNFLNSTGLPDEGHYSSARDMALLTKDMIKRFPEHYQLYSERSFKFNNIEQPNRNRLLRYDRSVDGVKTGYTKAAGYCLVASAERNGMRLISVVMGAENDDSRVRESQKLLTYGFRNFETSTIYEESEIVKSAPLFYGVEEVISLGVSENVSVTIPRGSYEKLEAQIKVPKIIEAPVRKGDVLGELLLMMDEEAIYRTSVISLENYEQAGFFSRFSDYLELIFLDES